MLATFVVPVIVMLETTGGSLTTGPTHTVEVTIFPIVVPDTAIGLTLKPINFPISAFVS